MKSEKTLLKLLDSADQQRVEGKTRLQKLVFLLDKEKDDADIPDYDFKPYNYGPFSKSLLEEIEDLEKQGFVNISKERTLSGSMRYDYEITNSGRKRLEDIDVESTFGDAIDDIVREYEDLPLLSLIDVVYENHPDYAENSNLNA